MKTRHPLAKNDDSAANYRMVIIVVIILLFAIIWGRSTPSSQNRKSDPSPQKSDGVNDLFKIPGTAGSNLPQTNKQDEFSKPPVMSPADYANVTGTKPAVTSAGWLRILETAPVNALLADPKGTIWAATERGLSKIEGERVLNYTAADGSFPGPNATALAHDGTSLWIGSFDGLFKTSGNGKFEKFTQKEGLANDIIWSLHWDGSILWIGTQNGFSFLHPKNGFQTVDKKVSNEGLADVWIRGLFRTGSHLIAGNDDGVSIWRMDKVAADPDAWITLDMFDHGLIHNWIFTVTFFQNNLWLGTPWGLSRLKTPIDKIFEGSEPAWDTYTVSTGLPGSRVNALAQLNDILWIGTDKGLCRLDQGKLVSITSSQGLISPEIRALTAVGSHIWIGTDKGIQQLDTAAVP